MKKGFLFNVFDQAGKYVHSFYILGGDSVIAIQANFLYLREHAEDGSLRAVRQWIVNR